MVEMMGSSLSTAAAAPPSHPLWWHKKVGPPTTTPFILLTATAWLPLLHSSFEKLSHHCHVSRLKDIWCEKASELKKLNFLQFPNIPFASTCPCWLCFFNEGETGKEFGYKGSSQGPASRRSSSDGRNWTYIVLAINVLVYIAQVATEGRLTLWGAKINSLIDKGQFWRLATSCFLHSNIGHLMVNCYSLNSIGPTVESLCGPGRFLAVYFTSAIACSASSYWFSKAPAVGASGAIFGLVGSLAVFIIRHRSMIRGSKEELQHIAQVILVNMAIGMLSRSIDNWGHLGGLLGGIATSWFVGPAWKYESLTGDGRRIFVDKAPIKYFTNIKKERT